MGVRFRRTVTLVPGIRLNLSGSGLSVSAGPRGASVTFGRNGIYGNVGVPGSGLSYRTRLDTPRNRSNRAEQQYVPMSARVLDDGSVLVTDPDGHPMTEALEREALRQNGPAIIDLLERRALELMDEGERMFAPHYETPAPDLVRLPFVAAPFELPKPAKPEPVDVGLISSLFGGREKAESRYRGAQAQYGAALAEWRAAEANHQAEQDAARERHQRWKNGDQRAMEERFEERLAAIFWPRETNISFQMSERRLWLDVDLPEIEDLPREKVRVAKKDMRLAFVPKSEIDLRRDYMTHVHSIAFRLLGEAFAAMPALEACVVAGYSQRCSRATGAVENEYLYSIRVERSLWMKIDFSNLRAVDPVEAVTRFDLRRSMTSTGIFRPIVPHQ